MPMLKQPTRKPNNSSTRARTKNVQAVLLKAFSSSNASPVKPTVTRGQREWINYIAK
ncbi:hypothetical protein AAC03nite_38050 [Alicyclobacillus acidoterrestris]|nr:hypothetical protein AAC03nite_38050 [Alicyclobacillus acidoterrestris]